LQLNGCVNAELQTHLAKPGSGHAQATGSGALNCQPSFGVCATQLEARSILDSYTCQGGAAAIFHHQRQRRLSA
jgi:hypothetical protein